MSDIFADLRDHYFNIKNSSSIRGDCSLKRINWSAGYNNLVFVEHKNYLPSLYRVIQSSSEILKEAEII